MLNQSGRQTYPLFIPKRPTGNKTRSKRQQKCKGIHGYFIILPSLSEKRWLKKPLNKLPDLHAPLRGKE